MKKALLAGGLFVSLFFGLQFTGMVAAQASVPAHATAVAGVMHGYSAPRHFGETHQQAVRRNLGQCGSDKFCAWHLYQWQGEYDQYYPATMQFIGYSLPGTGDNNTASSWFNNSACGAGCGPTDRIAYLYDDAHCISYPWYRSMVRGQVASAEGSDWDDRVSSYNGTLNYSC
jgi:hypothetical protein